MHCEKRERDLMRMVWLLVVATAIALAPLAAVAESEEPEGETTAGEEKRELRIDPLGRTDALTLLFYPDTPRPEREPEQPVFDEPEELTREELIEASAYPWQIPLWEAAGAVLADEIEAPADAWAPDWYFFPAEGGATLAWLVLPLNEALPEGHRLVAMLRGEDEGSARVLGSDDFPFTVRETPHGLVATAARSLEPGRYALAAGLAEDGGGFTLRAADPRQIVARVPSDRLRLSKVILADSLEKLPEGAEPGPFRVSGFEVVPRATSVIKHGEEVTIFYQVLGAGRGADGDVDLKVIYQLYLKNPRNKAAGWIKGAPPVVADGQKGAARGWSLPIVPQYPETDYKLEVTIADNIGGGTVRQSVLFSVEKP